MKKETLQFLQEAEEIPWLSQIGKPSQIENTLQVANKTSAKKFLNSLKWDNLHTAVMNRHFHLIRKKIDSHSKDYNDLVVTTRESAYSVGDRIIQRLEEDYRLEIRGTICSVAFEIEFSEFTPPLFYVPLILPIYKAGHLVCGWEGDKFPNDWNGNGPEDIPSGKFRIY